MKVITLPLFTAPAKNTYEGGYEKEKESARAPRSKDCTEFVISAADTRRINCTRAARHGELDSESLSGTSFLAKNHYAWRTLRATRFF